MAATGYTPISLYYSTTAAAVPVNTNLVNGELAINITDGKLYYKDNAGVVKLLASNASTTNVTTFSAGTTGFTPSSATSGAVTLAGTLNVANGGTGLTTLTSGYIPYGNGTSAFNSSANFTFDGTNTVTIQNDAGGFKHLNGAGTLYTRLATDGIYSTGTDIYMYAPASYANVFYAGGAERMRISSTGYVGIGNSSPAAPLSVSTQYTGSLSGSSQSYGAYLYPSTSGTVYLDALTNSTSNTNFYLRTYNNTTYNTFYFDLNGRFGVGVSPSAMLQAAASATYPSLKVPNIVEATNVVAGAPAATQTFYMNLGAVQYYTSNAANNWTVNFAMSSGTSLNTAMAVGDSMSCTMLTTQGSTAYYNSAVQIDGASVTPKWQGGSAPTSGNASGIDSYTYVIYKTASATYTVLASQTKFA